MTRFGISPKTATLAALHSTSGITRPTNTRTAGGGGFLPDLEKRSSSEPETATLALYGGSSKITAYNKASTVRCSGTKVLTDRVTLSDKLTRLLISAGLVKGITHTSIRKRSGAAIRDSALWPLDGGSAE
jgi:hypothetical protein